MTTTDKTRSRAARELFGYVFQMRYKRQPQSWEWAIGLALLSGELVVHRPPESSQLRTIHLVANDVVLALDLPELLSEKS